MPSPPDLLRFTYSHISGSLTSLLCAAQLSPVVLPSDDDIAQLLRCVRGSMGLLVRWPGALR